jgi:hypothetical protein
MAASREPNAAAISIPIKSVVIETLHRVAHFDGASIPKNIIVYAIIPSIAAVVAAYSAIRILAMVVSKHVVANSQAAAEIHARAIRVFDPDMFDQRIRRLPVKPMCPGSLTCGIGGDKVSDTPAPDSES